ncbi:MAG: FkbM family methyltransferase [Acidimicrobiia bacterium]
MSSAFEVAVSRWMGRHRAPGRTAGRVLDALGATAAAHRVRTVGDVVSVEVPLPGGRSPRIEMRGLGGRDQVARALRTGGWASFEHPLPTVVCQVLRRSPTTFFDVGANTGFYSLIAAVVAPEVRITAFEPLPEARALLEANLALNGLAERVVVDPRAVGATPGTATLHIPVPLADGTVETSASLSAEFKGDQVERGIDVAVTTLDEAWLALGRPPTSFVKVDVEGAEPAALAGSTALVDGARPILSVEVLPGADLDALDAFRRELSLVDVTLGPYGAVVGHPAVVPHMSSFNHLFVPAERVGSLVADLRTPHYDVTVL